MGSTTTPASQVITLPQGGGALHGIGEKFAPALFPGTGNFTIPLTVPAGRNGFQPRLNLVYSTGNGNGPFCLGWSLSIPGVSRKTSQGIPVYDNTKDTFLLSGAADLVPVPEGAAGTTAYRPRTEGLDLLAARFISNSLARSCCLLRKRGPIQLGSWSVPRQMELLPSSLGYSCSAGNPGRVPLTVVLFVYGPKSSPQAR